jgi:RNA polymerase sigma factor (sigma-70 family)
MRTEAPYEELRPLLFSIAYRMVSSVSEAEDIVQEAFLRVHRAEADGAEIESPKAYLSAVVTRLSIDHLKSARARREQYLGQWLPEPLPTDTAADAAAQAETADSLSMAFLVPRARREADRRDVRPDGGPRRLHPADLDQRTARTDLHRHGAAHRRRHVTRYRRRRDPDDPWSYKSGQARASRARLRRPRPTAPGASAGIAADAGDGQEAGDSLGAGGVDSSSALDKMLASEFANETTVHPALIPRNRSFAALDGKPVVRVGVSTHPF